MTGKQSGGGNIGGCKALAKYFRAGDLQRKVGNLPKPSARNIWRTM